MSTVALTAKTGLQLWGTWTPRWRFKMLGKLSHRISRFLPKTVQVIAKGRSTKPWLDRGCSKLSDQRKQAKFL
jgi:hypothetical protein